MFFIKKITEFFQIKNLESLFTKNLFEYVLCNALKPTQDLFLKSSSDQDKIKVLDVFLDILYKYFV